MTKRELKLEDGRTLKEWVADNREPASEQTDLRERIEEALNGLVLVLPQHESIPFKMVEITLSKDAEWIPQIVSRIMPLLPQSAAPDEARVREWLLDWKKNMRGWSVAEQGRDAVDTKMLLDFARTFPPSETNPVLIDAIKYALEWLPDADETHTDDHRIENFKFVKVLSEAVTNSLPSRSSRNDASQSGPPREIPLALSRDEIVKRGDDKSCQGHRRNLPMSSINPLYHCNPDDLSDVCRCTAIGTAIYELILEAVGAKP